MKSISPTIANIARYDALCDSDLSEQDALHATASLFDTPEFQQLLSINEEDDGLTFNERLAYVCAKVFRMAATQRHSQLQVIPGGKAPVIPFPAA